MHLKLGTRISSRQFRRNPTLQTLVEEAAQRYKAERLSASSAANTATVRVVERVVRVPAHDDTKLPRGWLRKLFHMLDMSTGDVFYAFGGVPREIDTERHELANTHQNVELRTFRNNIDRAIAKLMAARDEITKKMDADVKAAADERARQL